MAAAGTGNSFVVGAIADAWRHGDPDTRPADPGAGANGGGVFGLAPYQVAADVITREGVAARNMASWLAAQRRLDSPRPGGSLPMVGHRAGRLVSSGPWPRGGEATGVCGFAGQRVVSR